MHEQEIGQVVAVENGMATVELLRTSACAKCKACSLGEMPNTMRITLPTGEHIHTGDRVRIGMAEGFFWFSLGILCGIPFLSLLVGIGFGLGIPSFFHWAGDWQWFAALCGLVFAVVAFMVIKTQEPRFRRMKAKYMTLEHV